MVTEVVKRQSTMLSTYPNARGVLVTGFVWSDDFILFCGKRTYASIFQLDHFLEHTSNFGPLPGGRASADTTPTISQSVNVKVSRCICGSPGHLLLNRYGPTPDGGITPASNIALT